LQSLEELNFGEVDNSGRKRFDVRGMVESVIEQLKSIGLNTDDVSKMVTTLPINLRISVSGSSLSLLEGCIDGISANMLLEAYTVPFESTGRRIFPIDVHLNTLKVLASIVLSLWHEQNTFLEPDEATAFTSRLECNYSTNWIYNGGVDSSIVKVSTTLELEETSAVSEKLHATVGAIDVPASRYPTRNILRHNQARNEASLAAVVINAKKAGPEIEPVDNKKAKRAYVKPVQPVGQKAASARSEVAKDRSKSSADKKKQRSENNSFQTENATLKANIVMLQAQMESNKAYQQDKEQYGRACDERLRSSVLAAEEKMRSSILFGHSLSSNGMSGHMMPQNQQQYTMQPLQNMQYYQQPSYPTSAPQWPSQHALLPPPHQHPQYAHHTQYSHAIIGPYNPQNLGPYSSHQQQPLP